MGIVFRLAKKNKKNICDGIVGNAVLARFRAHDIDLYAKTGVFAPEKFTDHGGNTRITWADGKVVIPRLGPKDSAARKVLAEVRDRLDEIERNVNDAYADLSAIGKKPWNTWLQEIIEGQTNSSQFCGTLADILEIYIKDGHAKVSYGTLKHYMVLLNTIRKYESENRITWMLDTITPRDLERFAAYVQNGNSKNYVASVMKKFRTFVRWANGMNKNDRIEPLTTNNPFDLYTIDTELYGTPCYITVDERNRIYTAPMPSRHLAVQRDIFVFQSVVGCRVSDLLSRTKNDVVNGALEYIPRKTKDGRPITVRVPLNNIALEILERYSDCGERLLPFISAQKYNDAIKEVFKAAGVTRMVTILNPKTRMEEKRPINEVATSHMARRTFIGNIYKKVKDPNLVGKLSGHKENSRAFARYRDIDDDMARELVALLE